jgi:hypothetical protein
MNSYVPKPYSSSRKRGEIFDCYLITSRGESGIDDGVPGKIVAGDPALEYSNEWEWDKGGV